MDQQPESGTMSQEPCLVRLEAVVPCVSTPVLHGARSYPDGPDEAELVTTNEWPDEAVGPPQIASELADRLLHIHLPRALGLDLVIAAATALVEVIWNSDVQLAFAGCVVVAALTVLWIGAQHLTFSFGEGFVGFRPDTSWPQGVQEDDDVKWDWQPHRVAANDLRRPTR